MTRIDFYHDAPDRLRTAARITRKAVDQNCRVVLWIPDMQQYAEIDRLLWAHPPTGFLPHCRADSKLAAETPVLLAPSLDAVGADDVLINLGDAVPAGFTKYRRLIEIIGRGEAEKMPARERFRFYRDQGYEINRHDLGAAERNG